MKKNVNDDDLVINSTRVVLEVNEMGKKISKVLRDTVESVKCTTSRVILQDNLVHSGLGLMR